MVWSTAKGEAVVVGKKIEILDGIGKESEILRWELIWTKDYFHFGTTEGTIEFEYYES